MTLLCMCKSFLDEAIARDCGNAYERALSDRTLNFHYSVQQTSDGFELRICYELGDGPTWDLEHDGFQPCDHR